jgi:hypothetical protein
VRGSKSKEIDPLDKSRPADVACAACGSVNYIDAGKGGVSCFGCKQPVSRSDFGATGLPGGIDRVKAQPLNLLRNGFCG